MVFFKDYRVIIGSVVMIENVELGKSFLCFKWGHQVKEKDAEKQNEGTNNNDRGESVNCGSDMYGLFYGVKLLDKGESISLFCGVPAKPCN